jgi:hypothetical protein
MKVARIKFRSGEVRLCGLGAQSLPQWWADAEGVGCIVGDKWGAKWSEVALVDVVEVADTVRIPETKTTEQQVDGIARLIHGGSWTPQGAA